jgi:hypothetical protein
VLVKDYRGKNDEPEIWEFDPQPFTNCPPR